MRPAGRVVGMLREARAQLGRELGHLLLLDVERGGERLARDVVGRAAEPAGDDQVIDAVALAADEVGDRLDLVRHGRRDHDLDAERLEPLGEPGRVRVRRRRRETTSLPIVRIALRWCSAQVGYSRRAGHISPAGVSAAKPVRIRRCPATAMPRSLRRTSQVACATPTNVSPRRKGGSRGTAAEPTSSATSGGFLWSQEDLPGSRPGARAPAARLVAPLAVAPRPAGRRTADRLALADRDRGSVRDRRRARRSSRSTTSRTTRPNAPRTKLSGYTPNAEAIAGYKPDLVVVSFDGNGTSSRRSASCTSRCSSSRRRLDSPGAYAQIRQLGTGDRPRATAAARGREDEGADRGDRRSSVPHAEARAHRLPRARARPTTRPPRRRSSAASTRCSA